MTLRRMLMLTLVVFAATLAGFIGQRLNGEALTLMIGVALGWGLSLPGYYLLFRLAQRHHPTPSLPLPMATPVPAVEAPSGPRRFVFLDGQWTETPSAIILK